MTFVRSLLSVHHRLFAWPARLTSWKLRPKLMLAFTAMALMAGLCGSVGLLFVERIGSTVSVFSDVTSPLLIEGMALADNAQRMRAAFLNAASDGQSADQAALELSRLQADGRDHLQALRRLAARAGVDLKVDAAERRQRDFVQILFNMIASHRREEAAALTTKDRLARFDAKRREVEQHLLALANRAEGKMSKIEDEVRVQVQTGDATVDGLGELFSDTLTETYPVLQGAYKLTRQCEEIDELVKWYLAQTDLAELTPIEQEAQGAFKTISSVSKKLAGRLRDADGKSEFARIQQALTDLEVAILGAEGVFASQRDRLTAIVESATGIAGLHTLERAYLG
jgi:hypothetical protein